MLKEVYLGLKGLLSTVAGVEELDWFLGQYVPDDNGNVMYVDKGLYIEFEDIPWETLGDNTQRAVLGFSIHAVTACIYDDEQRVLNADVNHLDFLQEVFVSLMNQRLKNAQEEVILESIVRTNTRADHELEHVLVGIQTFEATIFDYSAREKTVDVSANIDLTIELQ